MSRASKPAKQNGTFIHGNHQGQRSMTARTGRTKDCTRPARPTFTDPLATREPTTKDIQRYHTGEIRLVASAAQIVGCFGSDVQLAVPTRPPPSA